MAHLIDIKFGRLTVIGYGSKRGYWLCKCECGTIKEIQRGNLKLITSCGCYRREFMRTHGQYKSAEYRAWSHMLERCTNPRAKEYHNYGGRGITVCFGWKIFETFLSDMGPRPSKHHSLDRINNNAGYSPENCRWTTQKVQHRNKRTNHLIEFRGEIKSMVEWCEILDLNYGTVAVRLNRYGWTVEQALTLKPQKGRKP